MNLNLKNDLATFDQLLEATKALAAHSLMGLNEQVVAIAKPQLEASNWPVQGQGGLATLHEFALNWAPLLSACAGPRYLGFVTGGATPASVVGDWLTSVVDQNPTADWDSHAADLERETVRAMAALFGLPEAQDGSFVTGATLSNFVGLALGREWVGRQLGVKVSEQGLAALGPVAILSGSPHSSIYKAASMLGLGRNAIARVSLQADREAVDLAALEHALRQQQGRACIVVANAGTVNSGDFDDLQAILKLRQRYSFWLHVDAAFGAFAALDERVADQLEGLGEADSICIDCHKWLNVPYDSALQYTRHRDLQVAVFQNSAAYLGAIGERPEFVHLTPENSRRWRALATWFALKSYGREGQADIVKRNIDCARDFGDLIQASPQLELLAPVRLNIVCFAVRGCEDAGAVQEVLLRLRDSGEAFLTPTLYLGRWGVRAAFSNWRTTAADVQRVHLALLKSI